MYTPIMEEKDTTTAKTLTGFVTMKPRFSENVTYLTIAESMNPDAPTIQWVFFKKEHSPALLQQIKKLDIGTSVVCMGIDNYNKIQQYWQKVVKSVQNIVPPDAPASSIEGNGFDKAAKGKKNTNAKTPTPTPISDASMLEKQLQVLLAGLPKDEAIAALSKQIAKLAGGN